MSDRIKGFIVTLEKDMRDDDAQNILDAISMMRGVARVDFSKTNSGDHINRMQIRTEISKQLFNVLYPDAP